VFSCFHYLPRNKEIRDVIGLKLGEFSEASKHYFDLHMVQKYCNRMYEHAQLEQATVCGNLKTN
jgi:hypothetical protein